MQKEFDVLLFDLGGVLLEAGPHPVPPEWLPATVRLELSEWSVSATATAFEAGRLSASAFAASLQSEFGVQASVEDILCEFTKWPIGLYEGVPELLNELRESYTVAILSNSNELHWPRVINEFRLPDYCDRLFASHELGLVKPDPEIFRVVLESLGVDPAKVLYFDDNAANVAAAEAFGMQSLHVNGMSQVRDALRDLAIVND